MLPHLPLSYLGEQYQFRQADGSDNNIHYPDLGRSGRPYSRILRPGLTESAKPDPGLLFDSLMSRGSSFEPNKAGISSLFLHYSIIIANDINFTNISDSNINDASSYLDLSPLYGSNQEQQNKVRQFKDGLLKLDTFADIRYFSYPPGVNVLLVMYNRFHNWAARTIAGINEKGRFTPPADLPKDKADAWRDEQLFQVTRLITIGLYVSIITHDYFRALFNIATTGSSGDTVDGLALQDEIFDRDAVPKSTGNHVSVESTFLYRFYSLISQKDALWIEDLLKKLTPNKTARDLSVDELLEAFTTHGATTPEDPSKWVFGGLERLPTGMFPDAGLVKILAESIEDPAGRFGPFHDPDVMRPIVMLGITQARKSQVASLNQYRKLLELEPFGKFDEINTNPEVAQTLAHLYRDVDNVELYPGIFTENINPESRLASEQSTMVRGLLSELKALVGRDRFLTQDFTPANLTSWGYRWISPDYQILFGSKIYLLILNAFPRFIRFNSVYAMQPFFTPPRSREILKDLGIDNLFSFDPPATVPASPPIPVMTWAGYEAVVTDQKNFPVPWAPNMTSLRSFMLASDTEAAAAQKHDVLIALYDDVNTPYKEFGDFSKLSITQLLAEKSHQLGRGPNKVFQVDFVRDVANLAAARFIAALCYFPLNTGTPEASYTDEELYTVLAESFIFLFADIGNPTLSWVRRRDGGGGTERLCQVMEKRIAPLFENTSATASTTGCPFGHGSSSKLNADSDGGLPSYGINFAKRLVATGRKLREIVEILVGLGVGMVANAGMLFSQLCDFYLQEKNASHWEEIKRLAADNTKESDEILTKYILEGYRIANSLALLRAVAGNDVVVPGVKNPIPAKSVIFLDFVGPCQDPSAFPDPLTVRLDRPIEKYSMFSFGPHKCAGRQLNLAYCLAMLKVVAGLPGLRRSPGDAGVMHSVISSASGLKSYLSPDLSIITPLPTTMSLMWDAPA